MTFSIMGRLLAVAASNCLLTTDVISGPLGLKGEFLSCFSCFSLCNWDIFLWFIPVIVTGEFLPAGSYFCIAAGLFVSSLGLSPMAYIISFISGALVITGETFLLGKIGGMLNKFPALRELGDHIRNAMSQILRNCVIGWWIHCFCSYYGRNWIRLCWLNDCYDCMDVK